MQYFNTETTDRTPEATTKLSETTTKLSETPTKLKDEYEELKIVKKDVPKSSSRVKNVFDKVAEASTDVDNDLLKAYIRKKPNQYPKNIKKQSFSNNYAHGMTEIDDHHSNEIHANNLMNVDEHRTNTLFINIPTKYSNKFSDEISTNLPTNTETHPLIPTNHEDEIPQFTNVGGKIPRPTNISPQLENDKRGSGFIKSHINFNNVDSISFINKQPAKVMYAPIELHTKISPHLNPERVSGFGGSRVHNDDPTTSVNNRPAKVVYSQLNIQDDRFDGNKLRKVNQEDVSIKSSSNSQNNVGSTTYINKKPAKVMYSQLSIQDDRFVGNNLHRVNQEDVSIKSSSNSQKNVGSTTYINKKPAKVMHTQLNIQDDRIVGNKLSLLNHDAIKSSSNYQNRSLSYMIQDKADTVTKEITKQEPVSLDKIRHQNYREKPLKRKTIDHQYDFKSSAMDRHLFNEMFNLRSVKEIKDPQQTDSKSSTRVGACIYILIRY